MRPVLLPFWLFEAAIKVEYTAQVSKRTGNSLCYGLVTILPYAAHMHQVIPYGTCIQ